MIKRAMLASVAVCGLAWGSSAVAEVDATVRKALELHVQGQPKEAYALLAPMETERAGDPDFDYALGIAAADSGRPAEAIMAFQRVLAQQPANAQARAELARAYAIGGDIDTAREEFDTALQDPTLPDPVRQRFEGIVRTYDKEISGGGSNISGFADVSFGADSNINAATDRDSILIPLFAGFGPGALGPGAQSQDDTFLDITAGVSGVHALNRQTRVFASALGNFRDNSDSDDFDQAAGTLTIGVAHTLANRDVISASAQAQEFLLDEKEFRSSVGGVLQYTKRLDGGKALIVSGEYFDIEYDNDPLRDGFRYGGGLSYATRNYVLSASGGREETDDSAADHLTYNYARVNAGIERQLTNNVTVVAGAGAQIRRYAEDDPLFLEEREDEQADVNLGLKVQFADDIYLRPRVTYTRNWSNIDLYDYERATASIGIRYEF